MAGMLDLRSTELRELPFDRMDKMDRITATAV
jgi:hypothetical protein